MRAWATGLLVLMGCALSRPEPPRSSAVAWQDFAPYLVANLWPHAVTRLDAETFAHVPPKKEDLVLQADADLHFGTCLGPIYRGFGLIAAPEPRLLEEGCRVVQESPVAAARIEDHLRAALLRHPEQPTEPVGQRLRAVRRAMGEAVAADEALRAAVCDRDAALLADC